MIVGSIEIIKCLEKLYLHTTESGNSKSFSGIPPTYIVLPRLNFLVKFNFSCGIESIIKFIVLFSFTNWIYQNNSLKWISNIKTKVRNKNVVWVTLCHIPSLKTPWVDISTRFFVFNTNCTRPLYNCIIR